MHTLRGILLGCVCGLSACAPLRGYPSDIENTSEVLNGLKEYFSAAKEDEYFKASGDQQLRLRNQIVFSRIRAYDIEFDDFQQRLYGDGNALSVGGGLAAMVLAGLGATTGHAGTAAALAASAAGLAGGQAILSKELYFQRTVPALIAQMQANRANAKATVLDGMRLGVDAYPLEQAVADLGRLKSAGSIPSAVSNITQQAETNKAAAEQRVAEVRTGKFSSSATSERLKKWVFPNGTLNAANRDALIAWMKKDTIDLGLPFIPWAVLVRTQNPLLESDRQRAIVDLNIP